MRVEKVRPEATAIALFPSAAFADAYRLIVDEPDIDAITAARRVLERAPGWIRRLLAQSNCLADGSKAGAAGAAGEAGWTRPDWGLSRHQPFVGARSSWV